MARILPSNPMWETLGCAERIQEMTRPTVPNYFSIVPELRNDSSTLWQFFLILPTVRFGGPTRAGARTDRSNRARFAQANVYAECARRALTPGGAVRRGTQLAPG